MMQNKLPHRKSVTIIEFSVFYWRC